MGATSFANVGAAPAVCAKADPAGARRAMTSTSRAGPRHGFDFVSRIMKLLYHLTELNDSVPSIPSRSPSRTHWSSNTEIHPHTGRSRPTHANAADIHPDC